MYFTARNTSTQGLLVLGIYIIQYSTAFGARKKQAQDLGISSEWDPVAIETFFRALCGQLDRSRVRQFMIEFRYTYKLLFEA